MKLIGVLSYYISWHYTLALGSIYNIWTNFMWFVLNFFSMPVLLKTLFAPWWRIHEEYQKGAGIGEYFGDKVVNLIMRIVGFCIRIVTIVIGLLALLITFLAGIAFYVVWLLMPLILLFIIGYGIKRII